MAWTCRSTTSRRSARSWRLSVPRSWARSGSPRDPAQRGGAGVARRAGRELLEHPLRVELGPPVRAPAQQHVVARARVHRQVRLDRGPLVVLTDQLVELLEPPRAHPGAPAPRELVGVVPPLLLRAAVGALERPPVAPDGGLDLAQPLHVARQHAGLEIRLNRPLRLPHPARQRLAVAALGVDEAALEPLLDWGTGIVGV